MFEKKKYSIFLDWTLRFTKLSENQGGCGSCAFFATAGTIDAAYQLQKNQIIDTSEEELYDCVQNDAQKQACGGQHVAFSKKYLHFLID